MPLGIDPTVDFAFKLMLGNPRYPAVTIHFLNAILRLRDPIASVEILNPIQDKDRSEDKLVVLDILARDSEGRRFNVEMQSTRQVDLPRRLLYYSTLSYVRQLREGDSYTALRPVYSISVLKQKLFTATYFPRHHHSFRLRCDQAELIFTNDLEFHTLELPKFTPSSDNIGGLPPEEKWLYLLIHADTMDPEELQDLLVDPPFREAIGILEMISKTPEDLQFYEARLKFLRDQQSQQEAAEQAARDAREEGRKEGREEGRPALIATVRLLEELVGDSVSPEEMLMTVDFESLTKSVAELQQRLRSRNE